MTEPSRSGSPSRKGPAHPVRRVDEAEVEGGSARGGDPGIDPEFAPTASTTRPPAAGRGRLAERSRFGNEHQPEAADHPVDGCIGQGEAGRSLTTNSMLSRPSAAARRGRPRRSGGRRRSRAARRPAGSGQHLEPELMGPAARSRTADPARGRAARPSVPRAPQSDARTSPLALRAGGDAAPALDLLRCDVRYAATP